MNSIVKNEEVNSKAYIADYFRKRVIRFPDFYSRRPLLPIEQWIVDQIPPGSNVLDLCCGGGETSVAMAERDARITGIDNVYEMCDLCRTIFQEKGYDGRFFVGDAIHLPFDDAEFTHVVCSGSSLNSMTNEDARLTMLEAARVLQPGGTVYFAILNPRSIRSVAAIVKGMFQRAPIWAFYSRNSYGVEPGEEELPRGMFYVIPSRKMKRYMADTGLTYRVSDWNIGFLGYQASMTILIGEKR